MHERNIKIYNIDNIYNIYIIYIIYIYWNRSWLTVMLYKLPGVLSLISSWKYVQGIQYQTMAAGGQQTPPSPFRPISPIASPTPAATNRKLSVVG